jgi:phosphoribosylformimino-5-aminoimidazole carboxamide ribotide isomerase
MKFRPCIDLHNGVVKQIVGSTLTENTTDKPIENFVASKPAAEFARQYQEDDLHGGHVIMLGPGCEEAALEALNTFPGGLQIGGGITCDNAKKYLDAGASHVVVTSFVFQNGQIDMDRLRALVSLVGKDRIVIDLSCRKKPENPDGPYYVVTNKWTQFTDYEVK